VIVVLLTGVPTTMPGGSTADFIHETHTAFQSDRITIKQSPPSVAEWPVIGNKLHGFWSQAANDLPALLQTKQPLLGDFSKTMLGFVGNAASGMFQFLLSLVIAGIMKAYGQSGSAAMLEIIRRLTGPAKGEQLYQLSTTTIRSVSLGIIGVAFIQALLLGIGFVWADVPAAGLIGLFVGAVFLALGYVVFMDWLAGGESEDANLAGEDTKQSAVASK